jgi:hypothetical protein
MSGVAVPGRHRPRGRWPGRVVVALAAAALTAGGCSSDGATTPATTAPGSSATGGSGDGWTTRAAAPVERTEVGAAALGGRIWVLGGFAGTGQASADVVAYDPAADAWTTGPALPQALHHPAVAADGSRLWVAGGYASHQLAGQTAAVRFLEPATGRWQDGPPLPEPRAAGALAWDGARLVHAGGVGPDGLAGDVFVLENGSWRRIGELHPPREHLAVASDGRGTTWFLAGRSGGIDTNLPDVDVVTGDTVRRIGALPTARGGLAGFHVPGAGGCAVGGEAPSGTFVEVECMTAEGKVTTLPPLRESRHGLGAVVVAGTAYALLGGPEPGLTVSDSVQALRLPPG